jgi:tetratricopeptide (TPR) repeat protein
VAPITRTCSLLLAGAALIAAPAAAKRTETTDGTRLSTFVGARAAALSGDLRRSALLYASLAEAEPGNEVVANRAIVNAIDAGDIRLALRLAERRPPASLPVNARLLLTADRLAKGKEKEALALLRISETHADLGFLAPVVEALQLAERRDDRALRLLDEVPANSAVAPYLAEQRALILLRLRRADQAEPMARRAIGAAGPRETRLRLALADGFMRLDRRETALSLLEGRDAALFQARDAVRSGRQPGGRIERTAEVFSELLLALALDLNRGEARSLAVAMAQVARHADRSSAHASLVLGQLLAADERTDHAVAVLRAVPDGSAFAVPARNAEVRALLADNRQQEAFARAQAFVADAPAGAEDFARLGDVLSDLGRHGEAADAFGRALALVQAGQPGPEAWVLHLLRGGELEQAERWAESRSALEASLALAPDNPLVLNYLGYAKLERGENLGRAEQLIAKASALAPDNASITDSLGWAQFKRGRVEEAIGTLQRAAATDPSQPEIHEHLGDALYTAGRKFEARHAWSAALITAEDDVRTRIQAKIDAGLSPTTAAP